MQNFDKACFCIFLFWQFRKMFDEDITNSACRFVCLVHCLFWTTGQTDGLSNSSVLYVLCYSAQEYTRRGVVLMHYCQEIMWITGQNPRTYLSSKPLGNNDIPLIFMYRIHIVRKWKWMANKNGILFQDREWITNF